MVKMKRKLFFLLVAALLLVPWTVAYAYDSAAAGTGQVEIVPAAPAALPEFNAFGHAIGGVTPGDLFFIDSSICPDDTLFTLYITNTDELSHNYRYLTLHIGTYIRTSAGGWEIIPAGEGTQAAIYLTLQNGAASFGLAGGARYKITIDKGCFYCYGTGGEKTLARPDFYLTAN